ncbi:MAG: hypothetical protein IPI11_07390 [Haliscomenobacter sp.]|nr:hypothetical protein [Haliscomenobacter sp.]
MDRSIGKGSEGSSWTSLRWNLEDELAIDPMYFPEDRPEWRGAIVNARPLGSWEMGEIFEVEDPAASNALVREAIRGGINSPGFLLLRKLTADGLEALLNGIDPETVALNFGEFYPDKDPKGLLRQFSDWLDRKGADKSKVRGSIDFDPFLDWTEPPFGDLAQAIQFCAAELPHFKVLQINGRYYHAGASELTNELALMVAKGAEYLARMEEYGVPPTQTHHSLQFSVALSASFFPEIAKLRALRILWNNVLAAFGIAKPEPVEIVVHLAKETQDEQVHTNMIRAGAQAMSAIIGGADRLYVLPANAALKEAPTPFTRRIARNVHHLLRMESHLGRPVDPSAGSYYLEQLTDLLASKAWDKFQEYVRRGEFS